MAQQKSRSTEGTKEEAPKTKEEIQFVVAEVEQRRFDRDTGERLSKAFNVTYLPQEWDDFKVHGPNQGWYVNKVVEAPDGVDTKYTNPDAKRKQLAAEVRKQTLIEQAEALLAEAKKMA